MQAQTVANYHLAKEANLTILPVINKVLPPLRSNMHVYYVDLLRHAVLMILTIEKCSGIIF